MMSVSRPFSDKMRAQMVLMIAPLWEKIATATSAIKSKLGFEESFSQTNFNKLQLENQLLAAQTEELSRLLYEAHNIYAQFSNLSATDQTSLKSDLQNYTKNLEPRLTRLKWHLKAIPANVICRSSDTWNRCLWINVGEETNSDPNNPIVAKNSPVVLGRGVVGIIDYVAKHHARVCLISDTRLTPSVRALRGHEQDVMLMETADFLTYHLKRIKNAALENQENLQLINLLQELQEKLKPATHTWYLAKGELLGSFNAMRRQKEVILKGTGFNYDFADESGPARDLRTGRTGHSIDENGLHIIKPQDILVTTGMDGVFPEGFHVAIVTKVDVLKEGDYYYNLQAKPAVTNLDNLKSVFVLPPLTKQKNWSQQDSRLY